MQSIEQEPTRREKIIRAAKIILVVLLILAALTPYALAVYGLITQGRWSAWSGFGDYVSTPVGEGQEFQRGKTLWDLTQLLIIPLALGLGIWWLNRQERKTDREIAKRRDQTERDLSADRIKENALVAYLDRMTELLLERELRDSKPDDEVRSVARAHTLTVLRGLDPFRKGLVVQFLYESALISRTNLVIDLKGANLSNAFLMITNLREVDLSGADLTGAILNAANLSQSNLRDANLSGADINNTILRQANLCEANLSKAQLSGAELGGANLSEAQLGSANLFLADLSGAILSGAQLGSANLSEAKLIDANLKGAELRDADLSEANLSGAILSEADLSRAKLFKSNLSGAILSGACLNFSDLSGCISWTSEQLDAAASLFYAELPYGYTPPNQNSTQEAPG